jgi:membrane-associated phospholipid phosphatase
MTGLSRVYLGVHSVGQVLLGWAYGAYIIAFYIEVAHEFL